MKRPLNRNSPIDANRMADWVATFSNYRYAVNEQRIDRWLGQFQRRDTDIAARILDCVDFITNQQIDNAFRNGLLAVPGWHREQRGRSGKWRFVAYSRSAGESGDTMLHHFRRSNNLALKSFDELFIHKSDLVRETLGHEDTVVFVDDFSGSGKQVTDNWPELKELVTGNPRAFLVLVASSQIAQSRIERDTDLSAISQITITDEDNVFSARCRFFSPEERDRILHYCNRADPRNPRGFGDIGSLIVFAHDCPNNSIPILHASSRGWRGLFPRFT